jgi:hypothetical protein
VRALQTQMCGHPYRRNAMSDRIMGDGRWSCRLSSASREGRRYCAMGGRLVGVTCFAIVICSLQGPEASGVAAQEQEPNSLGPWDQLSVVERLQPDGWGRVVYHGGAVLWEPLQPDRVLPRASRNHPFNPIAAVIQPRQARRRRGRTKD